MSKDSTTGKIQISVYIDARILSLLRKRAEELGSQNGASREVFEDQYSWYSLPQTVVDVLREDAKKMGKPRQRDYVLELLMRRYTDLMMKRREDEK